jgi:predicted ATP-grasp superfamily ATP-dependent carboligase
VREHPAEWVDGFVTDEALVRLASLADKKLVTSLAGSRQGNNKYLLHQFLAARSLPVFDTRFAQDEGEVKKSVRELEKLGYKKGVVKAQLGASGIGMLRFDFKDEMPVPEYLFFEGACLVQGWLEEADGVHFLGSPSVQLFIGSERICLFDLTDQILSQQSVHEGNMAPPLYLEEYPDLKDELLRQAEIAARWLHEQGYRGMGSVDFHVISRQGACEVRVCEINARITGATYPSLLARLFRPEGSWLMRNIRFTQPYSGQLILDALDEACLLFHAGATSGVVPINFNLTRDGYVAKGQFLAIGADIPKVLDLFRCVRNLETIIWEYDRD